MAAFGPVAKYVGKDLVGGILIFPFWWYTKGLAYMALGCMRALRRGDAVLGFSVWARNLFVPMYGDDSWAGRAISFFMRVVVSAGLGVAMLVWSVVVLFAFILYLAVLPLSVFGVFYHASILVL